MQGGDVMFQNKLSNRQKLILKAIIESYVETNEPVGSKVLTEKPYLDFSSATIRYDMAYLEELGLLEKTHTSSGRVPSEAGYKYYVEHLVTRDYDVEEKFPLFDQVFSNQRLGREEVVKEAVKILSDMTNYMTVAYSGSLETNKIKKLDLVKINELEAILLVVTNFGHVVNQRIRIPKVGFDALYRTIQSLDKLLMDVRIIDVERLLRSHEIAERIEDYVIYQEEILEAFTQAFIRISQERMFSSGLDNIFNQPEFQNVERVRELISTLEQQNIAKMLESNQNGLSIKIGQENTISSMGNCTVISVPFVLSDDDPVGAIAVIGPTRMEYRKVIPLLEYIAKNISKLFTK